MRVNENKRLFWIRLNARSSSYNWRGDRMDYKEVLVMTVYWITMFFSVLFLFLFPITLMFDWLSKLPED